jgi:hypothetical protein
LQDTIEDLGLSECWVDIDVELSVTPGDPAVMYYSDMSGYPGTADEVEFVKLEVTAFGHRGTLDGVVRSERPEWFEVLDRIVEKRVLDGLDSHLDEWTEEINDQF